jgi:excisionase family DNA binding protein
MSDNQRDLLTTGEVARMFRVDPKTVSRWVKENKLPAIRTPGGQYRFVRATVEKFAEPS